jgi:hypothetical protein
MTTNEADMLAEELRKCDERLVRLRKERVDAERELLRPTARRNRALVLAVLGAIGAVAGFGAANRQLGARYASEAMATQAAHEEKLSRQRADNETCRANGERLETTVTACRNRLRSMVVPPVIREAPRKPVPCNCDPGDPLCSCL